MVDLQNIAKFIPPEQLYHAYGYHIARKGERNANEDFVDADDWFRNHASLWPVVWRHCHNAQVMHELHVPGKALVVLSYFCRGSMQEVPEPVENA